MSSLNIFHVTSAVQGIWQQSLTTKFIDVEQISAQELMALKRMPIYTYMYIYICISSEKYTRYTVVF